MLASRLRAVQHRLFVLQKKYRFQVLISSLAVAALGITWFFFDPTSAATQVTYTATLSTVPDPRGSNAAYFDESYRSDIDITTVSNQMQLETGGARGIGGIPIIRTANSSRLRIIPRERLAPIRW